MTDEGPQVQRAWSFPLSCEALSPPLEKGCHGRAVCCFVASSARGVLNDNHSVLSPLGLCPFCKCRGKRQPKQAPLKEGTNTGIMWALRPEHVYARIVENIEIRDEAGIQRPAPGIVAIQNSGHWSRACHLASKLSRPAVNSTRIPCKPFRPTS